MSGPAPQNVAPEVLNWLYRVLTPEYAQVNRTYSDTASLLGIYSTIKPRTNVYTDESGRPELLLCLYGTIPVTMGASMYRIPVEIWMPKQYPDRAPYVYVRPTETMMIHPGNHVDANGRCYHPYLSYWTENSSSNLADLVALLAEVFAREPPVYSKPAPAYEPATRIPARSPRESLSPPMASCQTTASPGAQQNISAYPPLPPKPPLPQYATHPSRSQAPAASASQDPKGYNQQQQQPRPTPPVDILTGMEDRSLAVSQQDAPMKPPNPQRVQATEYLQKSIDNVVEQVIRPEVTKDQEALQQTSAALDWMENTMARERAELDKLANAAIDNEKSLDERMEAAKRAILSAKARPSPDLDDGLSAETAVHNQLYHLVADDHAIDDALYILGKALDSDRIKLDQYMKHTRWLGREQFMKRALVLKISKQLNLIAS